MSIASDNLLQSLILMSFLQDDVVQEDWGWKLVHGEVFRTPPQALLLSVMVGNGSQLCAMVGVTLSKCKDEKSDSSMCLHRGPVFALFGFLSPSNRGSLATVMMICWTLFGRCVALRVTLRSI